VAKVKNHMLEDLGVVPKADIAAFAAPVSKGVPDKKGAEKDISGSHFHLVGFRTS
jgi:hypothetical protein